MAERSIKGGDNFTFFSKLIIELWSHYGKSCYEYKDCIPGLKRPECEADHSPPPSDKWKNVWSLSAFRFLGAMELHYTST
jgi:hypothetical protein